MRPLIILAVLGVVVTFRGASQEATPARPPRSLSHPRAATPAPFVAEAYSPGEGEESKKDPAYKTYKEGYDAILDERWNDAMTKFSEVLSKYTRSDYSDDAAYWKAYALSHIDRKQAITAYQAFLEKYPRSRFIDDAVADLGNLDPTIVVTVQPRDSGGVSVAPSSRASSMSLRSGRTMAEAEMRKSEALMRKMNSQLFRSFAPMPRIPRMATHPPMWTTWEMGSNQNVDPETRVRLEALYAIGETKEDETAFQTLKDVALDRTQNIRLRQAAIEILADFKKFDVMPVFVELARKDTNEGIQEAAVEFIGSADKDRNKSVEALISLFGSLPSRRKENVLFAIADVGNDKAVEFLTSVARTNEDYDLRSDAVYYLGTIGGEKARAALYQILRNK